MKNCLREQGKRNVSPGTVAGMAFLTAKDPATIKAMRTGMMQLGFKAHRLAAKLANKLPSIKKLKRQPPATVGAAPVVAQVIHFIYRPMPKALPPKTSRALMGIEDDTMVPVIRNPQKTTDDSDAVFYFPGCGSERLFSNVGLATQAWLYETGAITVLPQGYLFCAFPQPASGHTDHNTQTTPET